MVDKKRFSYWPQDCRLAEEVRKGKKMNDMNLDSGGKFDDDDDDDDDKS